MTVQLRIREYIKHERLSVTEFCDSIGVSNAYISSMKKSISQSKLQDIALKYPMLNIEWLLTGTGEMIKESIKTDVSTSLMQTTREDDGREIKIAMLQERIDELKTENVRLTKENAVLDYMIENLKEKKV